MKKNLDLLLRKIKKIDLSKLLKKDWLLKLISLVLAVVLWYFVGGEDRVDKNVMIPIEIINLPRDLVISNQFKKEIEVTVSGPRSLILEMSSRAITRQVDLSSATPGTMVIENDNDHIPVPRGITVQRVQPSSIILSLDKLIQKQFPISA
jgi:YbbR domain-containing protein